ncbi:YcaO-like family protein [Metasolibacillus meyeri]|uniref:YcaO-like family protein n=1 Tax=Metasolibacillus meyeri TaxID=1071052 RepID=UPI00187D146C|nr:YcaO-like family protein [Metasolibacillus meyeri]
MDLKQVKTELYNDKTGIIRRINKLNTPVGAVPLCAVVVTGNPVINDKLETIIDSRYPGLGFDFEDYEKAEIRAIGEFIERYASTVIPKKLLNKGSYTDLTNSNLNAMDPLTITRIRDEDLLKYQKKGLELSKDTEFYWIEGFDELKNISVWVPTDLVYLLPNQHNSFPIRDIISTGLATGPTLLDAKINGLLECIERDAIVIMWQNKISFPKIKLDSIKSDLVKSKIKYMNQQGLDVVILDISTDIPIPVYFCIIKNSSIPYFSVGAGAHFKDEIALESAFKEAITTYNGNVIRSFNSDSTFNMPMDLGSFKDMDEHSDLYSDNDFKDSLIFLEQGEEIDFTAKDNRITTYTELLAHLITLNIDYFTVDLTTRDLKDASLHVVRSITPQLAYLECSLPMLDCSRIKEVPKKLGYKVNNEYNTMPHPFP